MRRHSLVGFASFIAASSLFWAACGDNKPSSADGAAPDAGTGGTKDGGTGGVGGAGGTGGLGGAGMDGGVDQVGPLCTATFVSPTDGASLSASNGAGVGMCMTDGFHANITVATNQPDGTMAGLSVGNGPLVNAMVKGSTVTFSNVLLPQQTNLTLKVSFSTTCSTSIKVNSDCSLPACAIMSPKLSTSHPALNGVASTAGGDRVSANGAAYQVAFKVTTNVEDGQPVRLTVSNDAVSGQQTVLNATATGGIASFSGVTFVPDGTYTVQASCTNKAGAIGYSTLPAPYPVDTTAPDLTISSPVNGTFMGPTALTNGAFKVCAKTSSADAVSLPAALGADAVKNMRVYLNAGATPVATTAFLTAGTDACADVACPGGAPFTLRVTATDVAGNATEKTITGISCDSQLPSVQIVSPVGDASPYGDATKRLLASNSGNALKDQSAAAGAQWTVAACSNTSGMASLFAGSAGGTLQSVGTAVATVAAVTADGCPAGYGYVAKFANVTLPESILAPDGTLSSATELRVDLQAPSSAVGKSAVVDLWVDSTPPALAVFNPTALCGGLVNSDVDVSQSVRLSSNGTSGTLTVTNGGSATNYPAVPATGGFLDFGAVLFKLGANEVTGSVSEPSGNTASLPSPCVYNVGNPPVVTWQVPTMNQSLCAASTTGGCLPDADGNTAGWQGTFKVKVTQRGAAVTSGTVTFLLGGTTLGVGTLDGNGQATLPVTLADARSATLGATIVLVDGTGTASSTVKIDTTPPDPITNLTALVKSRRKTSYTLSWTTGKDGAAGTGPATYDIRYVQGATLNATTFASAVPAVFSGTAGADGSTQTLDIAEGPGEGLLIETPYTFGVVAVDAVGNRSELVTVSPAPATFKSQLLSGTGTETFGSYVDATADFNRDGKADLLVGPYTGTAAYLFFGAATIPTVPSVTFSSGSSLQFGRAAIACGDVDGDGFEDVAISSPGELKVYIFSGKKIAALTTPATIPSSAADYVVTADATVYTGSHFFGWQMARLGDFNQDGVDDFAVSAHGLNGSTGRVIIVLGKKPATDGTPTFSSFSLDNNATTRAIWIDGESPSSRFGNNLFGLGKFLETGGSTLVVSASGYNAAAGRVYAFGGSSGLGGSAFSPATALHFDGSAGSQAGYALAAVGTQTSNLTPFVVSLPLAGGGAAGLVRVSFAASAADGPFGGRSWTVSDSKAIVAVDRFAYAVLGGMQSGRSTALSIIGTSAPDVGFIPDFEAGASPIIYLVDGAKLASASGTTDIVTGRDIALPMANYLTAGDTWKGISRFSQIGGDINGDAYPDIFVGEFLTPMIQGRVLILY